jgi:ParB/RepB/Spo0J family partition protein
MHPHQPQQTIVSLPICRLHPHPDNANRMSKEKFAKLVRHIKATGHYEPVVVRRHPHHSGDWQILNGHHRVRALKQIQRSHADCVVFGADDEQARLYLLNLNHLCGRDNVYKKAKLIEQLCQSHSPRTLAKLLGDSKTSIEKLNALSQNQPLPKVTDEKPALLPMTFFVTEAQHALLTAAFDKAAQNDGPRSQQRIGALCRMAETFLENKSVERKRHDAITPC